MPSVIRLRTSSASQAVLPAKREFEEVRDSSESGSDFAGGDDEEPEEEDMVDAGASRDQRDGSYRVTQRNGSKRQNRSTAVVQQDFAKAQSMKHVFGSNDFSSLLKLKPDHASRPLWVTPDDLTIILEGFSPLSEQAQDFLVAVAEPVSRPSLIHEYKITIYSLYAAVSVGLEPKDITAVLNRLCKCPLPPSLGQFIQSVTYSFGKVKLVLKRNRFHVESAYPEVLQMLLRDPVLGPLRVESEELGDRVTLLKDKAPTIQGLVIPGTKPGDKSTKTISEKLIEGGEYLDSTVQIDREDEEDDTQDAVHSFEISPESVEIAKKQCAEIGYPVLEEYDFRNDSMNANLEIDLKPSAQIRPYQEKSLSKMFGNGRARSGIIVLPCGAGKTLVGITAACTIKKSVIILCTSSVSVAQWRQQFLQWTNVNADRIAVFTSESKERFRGEAGIVVSTYSMVANTGKRSHDSQKMMDFLLSREWGFVILDEVHVVPAAMFRRVASSLKAHTKLGLTATLLREDNKIDELNYLIGPKLYEANWMDLAQKGHIANVQCAEVWCPMTPEFYTEYLQETSRKRMLLYIMNPKKFQACQFLIEYHEKRGDKVIVFSDNVFALKAYALKLRRYFIYGATPQSERMRILENFRYNELVNTIFLSSVGDTSIDLPEATCLIQISSHYGSRRQEAQRLGRILRAKRRNDEGFNAFFYSLVSKDTQEMYYSTKRQAFLVDQGYAFKVITHLQGIDELSNLAYKTRQEQRDLLQEVLLQNADVADLENLDELEGVSEYRTKSNSRSGTPLSSRPPSTSGSKVKAKRTAGNLTSLAGAEDMAYIEYNKSKNKELKPHHPIFRKIHKK